MDIAMSRHIRRSVEPKFPYAKSVAASCGLVVGTMFLFIVLSDPASGEIRAPGLAWLTIAGLPVIIAAVFYTEFWLRNKRALTSSRPASRGTRVKPRRRATDVGGRGKC